MSLLPALKKAPIGPRSSVWTEKELLEACVHEYSEVTEKFLQAAEKNFGVPYQWGKYDILVLPSAFPYAGMENPNVSGLLLYFNPSRTGSDPLIFHS